MVITKEHEISDDSYSSSEDETEDYFDIKEAPKPVLKLVFKLSKDFNNEQDKWVISDNAPNFGSEAEDKQLEEHIKRVARPYIPPPPPPKIKRQKKPKESIGPSLTSLDKSNIIPSENGDDKRSHRKRKAPVQFEPDHSSNLSSKKKFEQSKEVSRLGIIPVTSSGFLQHFNTDLNIQGNGIGNHADGTNLRMKGKKKKKRKKDPNKPKRAAPAFIFFANEWRQRVQKQFPELKFTEVSKKLGDIWKSVDKSERQRYEDLAAADLQRFNQDMARYVPPPQSDGESSEELDARELIERILGKRFSVDSAEPEYLIRWHGQGAEKDSWESLTDLRRFTEIIEAFERQIAGQEEILSETDHQLMDFMSEYSQFWNEMNTM